MAIVLAVTLALTGAGSSSSSSGDAEARATVAAWESQFADNPAVAEYLAVAHYLELVAEHERAVAEWVAAQPVPARAPSTTRAPGTGAVTVTGACGGATNGADQFIARESGGNPNVWNTGGSGAWGCYQIMPATWASSCADLGVHGAAPPDAQAACASRLPMSAWGG